MLNNFFLVLEQVTILFVLICVGAVAGKISLLKKEAIPSLNRFILQIVTPCVIIKSFYRNFEPSLLRALLLAIGFAFLTHAIGIFAAHSMVHDKEANRRCVLRFGTVFSNGGFMALPLLGALLGELGIFFGATYVAVLNIMSWTYGVVLMEGNAKNLSVRKLLLNPGIIGVCVGLLIFVSGINIPDVLMEPVGYLASLNTPLPMIMIGFMLWEIVHGGMARVRKMLSIYQVYCVIFLRLIVIPMIFLGILYILRADAIVSLSIMICASAPVAVSTTMFTERFHKDTDISVTLVSLSTVASLLTMPILIGLAKSILGA